MDIGENITSLATHITACTVVQAVVKANRKSNGKIAMFCDQMFLVVRSTFFLFIGSRCAETAERIFTIYTSYDVFPRKDVPFGGLVVTCAHLRGQKPPKPQFWGRE